MQSATSDDVAFWACMICSAVFAAGNGAACANIFSAFWLVFGVVIRVSAKHDARRMRERKDRTPGTFDSVVA